MAYSYGAILHVSEAGLEYLDDEGDVRFISFEACGQNAQAQVQNPAAQVCVARRMIQISPSGRITRTVEFYTRPPTVFNLESDMQFQRLRFRIEQMGWRVG